MSDDYAPFPEADMNALIVGVNTVPGGNCVLSSKDCEFIRRTVRSAIASYGALNERCLRAELERDHGVKP